MKTLFLALLIAALPACAQSTRTNYVAETETTPALVPATDTDVVTGSAVWITELTLTNITASDVYCTVKDRQTTARAVFGGDNSTVGKVTAGSLYVVSFKSRRMPGGITWSCSSGTAVVGFIAYRF